MVTSLQFAVSKSIIQISIRTASLIQSLKYSILRLIVGSTNFPIQRSRSFATETQKLEQTFRFTYSHSSRINKQHFSFLIKQIFSLLIDAKTDAFKFAVQRWTTVQRTPNFGGTRFKGSKKREAFDIFIFELQVYYFLVGIKIFREPFFTAHSDK